MANYTQIHNNFSIIPKKLPTFCPLLFIKIALLILFFNSNYNNNGVLATQYTVGGSSGWNLGVDYSTWASQTTFKTGDTLEFTYGSLHTVLQVSEADYNACSTSNAITTGTGGNTIVKLDKAQTYYFICGTPGHCGSGMQVSVKVVSASSTPATITTPTSPKSTPSSPTTTTTTSPKTSSSAPPLSYATLSLFTVLASLFFYTLPMFP
eukprot:c16098_g1_i1 orf=163-786(+)